MTRGKIWLGTVLIVVLAAATFVALRLGPVAAGYKAKTLCSGVFVSRRTTSDVLDSELEVADQPILLLVDTHVDETRQTVTARFLGLIERQALHRPGLGCTLAGSEGVAALRPSPVPMPRATRNANAYPNWPEVGEPLQDDPSIDRTRLDRVVAAAFSEPNPERPRRTRALIVLRGERLVAERYAPEFDADMPLVGWSMTKSVTATLAGLLVHQDRLRLDEPVPLSTWNAPNDPRGAITLDHLLRMTPGLEWSENYINPFSDVITLSWGVDDAAAFAAERPLADAPGSRWNYSSGTSTILARVLREAVGDDAGAYLSFPHRALFDPLGMSSAVFEPDAAGVFGGASFMYASARDWARYGLLHLRDGVWSGRRLLPDGWVDYATRLTPESGEDGYAAHFWLRIPPPYFDREGQRPRLPDDAYHAVGHWAQFVTVIPSRDLVVVRLGLAMAPWSWNHEAFLAQLLTAFD